MYDVIIIGAGPGGYVAAIKGAQLGLKVAIVEKEELGGICLNHGCIPTKTLLKSAKVYKEILKAASFGINLDKSSVTVDWQKMLKRKGLAVKKLTTGVGMLLKKNKVDIINGFAEVLSPTEVKVDKIYNTKNIIIATGAHAFIPNIKGVNEGIKSGDIVTYKELLTIDAVPNNLTIVGGGVIGIEFATLFSSLGSKVTIIEKDVILQNVDIELRETYRKILKKNKVKLLENTELLEVRNKKAIVNDLSIEFDTLLMSIGTKPNMRGLEKLNLDTYKLGVVTNNEMRTNINNIFAIGDVNGKINLAHVASAEGIVAVENIAGKNKVMDYTKVPNGVYGFPEIASVGLTEQELDGDYKISKFPLAANGRSLSEGDTEGYIKVITDKEYGELIGVHIIASNATELVSEAVVTMELEGTVFELAKSIHPHPTISEVIMEVAQGAIDKPIHM
jgi:dihydrolipoamide dehydrogenase